MGNKSDVFFASAHVKEPEADATLPAKLRRILEKIDLKNICRDDYVPIKIHLGANLGYTTIHPVFIRVLVEELKKAGGKPFIVEGSFQQVYDAAARGYTSETLGCPIVAGGGPYGTNIIKQEVGYRTLDAVNIFGAIWDAPCLINFSHVKGHGVCAYGGACKNIAMGCVDRETRRKIHSLEGGISWDESKCVFCGKCAEACDTEGIEVDKAEKKFRLFFHNCRYCRHCISACPKDALKMDDRDGFRHFQEGMAMTTKKVMDSFEKSRVLHINILTNITMFCDCWGFSTPAIVPDIGVFASNDMVAVEKASLDSIREENFIKGSLIGKWRLGEGRHLLEKIFGKNPYVQIEELERQGVGQSVFNLTEVK